MQETICVFNGNDGFVLEGEKPSYILTVPTLHLDDTSSYQSNRQRRQRATLV